MFNPASSLQSDYSELFGPLLSIHNDSDILNLVGEREKKEDSASISQMIGGLVSWRRSPSTDLEERNRRVIKLFRRKINEWIEILDDELEKARYEPDLLKSLQKVISKINSDGKIAIFREKLIKLNYFQPKVQQIFKKFEQIVFRILLTPPLENLQRPSEGYKPTYQQRFHPIFPTGLGNIYRFYPYPLMTSTHVRQPPVEKRRLLRAQSDSELFVSSAKKASDSESEKEKRICPTTLRKEMSLKTKQLLQQKSANEICIYNPRWGKGWEDRLNSSFKNLDNKGDLTAVAEKLEPIQVITIINNTWHDKAQEWKLIYLFGSINHSCFIEILQALDSYTINCINKIFNRSPAEALKWFEKAFLKHRDGLIDSNNRMKDMIDALAHRFRHDENGYSLCEKDMRDICELRDNVKLRIEMVRDKLTPILEGIIKHPVSRRVLFEEELLEYQVFMKRLTVTQYDPSYPAGCIFPIIYASVFEQKDAVLSDDDDAIEVFGEWSIANLEDYWQIGLFGTHSEERFKKLPKDDPNIHVFATGNLKKLGIETIRDWKRLNIFNRRMLTNFLNKEENKKNLTQWTTELLGGIV